MATLQEPDQVTYSFVFIITPLDIVSTKSIKNLKKSLLLKLGDRTQKTSELNKPIQIPVEVLYSKTLRKYCPIKGIIKVYDINLDGSEVISSVGGFQTEQILNQNKNNVIVERDVGTSKIKMKIQIKNLGIVKNKVENVSKTDVNKKQENKYPLTRSRLRQNNQETQPITLQKSRLSISNSEKTESSFEDQNKKQKPSQFFRRSTPMPIASQSLKFIDSRKFVSGQIKDETKKINQASSIKRVSLKTPFEQKDHSLKSIQSKNTANQINTSTKNVNENVNDQLNLLRSIIKQHEKSRQQITEQFDRIVSKMQTKNGKVWIENNQKDKTLSLKYKERGFDRTFNAFVEFMVFQLSKPKQRSYNSQEEQKISSIETKLQRQIKQLTQELSRKTNQIFTLRARQRQKVSIQPKFPSHQVQLLTNNIKDLQLSIKGLKQENEYMRKKGQQMDREIQQRQNQIQNLKQQVTEMQVEMKEMECTIKNDACEIEQLKQQISNLNQMIESYRQKYGDLKTQKNRALQNQLKQCLIWIDQQTRQLQMSDYVQQTQPSHSHNVSEIIKSIELQGASREEMNSIKIELAGLIKRIDNFLMK